MGRGGTDIRGPGEEQDRDDTMQMASVATNAGVAICWAPSGSLDELGAEAEFRWMSRISTVASSTRMPRQGEAAEGHHVERLPDGAEDGQRGQDRERDRGDDHERAAPAAEE